MIFFLFQAKLSNFHPVVMDYIYMLSVAIGFFFFKTEQLAVAICGHLFVEYYPLPMDIITAIKGQQPYVAISWKVCVGTKSMALRRTGILESVVAGCSKRSASLCLGKCGDLESFCPV